MKAKGTVRIRQIGVRKCDVEKKENKEEIRSTNQQMQVDISTVLSLPSTIVYRENFSFVGYLVGFQIPYSFCRA